MAAVLVVPLLVTACQSEATGPPDRSADLGPDAGPEASSARREAGAGDRASHPDVLRGPPYPIVLAHGFFGFDAAGAVDYFYKVKPALEADGHHVVVTAVDPFNSSTNRGEQLLAQVKQVLEDAGAAKVILIGHSQGGLDSRYVAARIPDRIAAVVTIATPHRGSKVADVLLFGGSQLTFELVDAFCKLLGRPLWGDLSSDPAMKASLEQLSSEGAASFNLAVPDAAGVAYLSIGGRSNLQLAAALCEAPSAPPFIGKYQGVVDPMDPAMLLTAQILSGSILDPAPNDGLVAVDSMIWGKWLGCIPADHLDEIGQLLGDSPGLGNTFDHLTFYRDLAAYLVSLGF